MKNNEYSTAINWHFIMVSLIFGVAILLMVLYMPNLREIDSNILQVIRKTLSPFPKFIPLLISEIGRNYYMWPLITLGSVLISHRYYLETFLLIFFTQAAFPITKLVKEAVCRQRPSGVLYPGYSFPSNHMLVATCFFGILIYLVIKHTYGFCRYFLVAFFCLVLICIGLSRLALGVHFLTDIIEGFLLGFILVNLFIILDKFFSRRV